MPWLIHWSAMPLEKSLYRRNSKYCRGSNGRYGFFHSQLENRRVLEIGRGNHNGVQILQRQQLIHVLERPRAAPINLLRRGRGSLAIDFPQVADRRHFGVLLVLELRCDGGQAAPAAA